MITSRKFDFDFERVRANSSKSHPLDNEFPGQSARALGISYSYSDLNVVIVLSDRRG